MKTGALLFTLFVLVVVVLLGAANATWSSRTAEVVAQLKGAGLSPPDSAFAPRQLEDLPAPVARYLRAALRDGAPLPWYAVIRHEGVFRADSVNRSGWRFRSVEEFDVRPPGYVWDARMGLGLGVSLFVRDAFTRSEGTTLARVAGLIPMVNAGGKAPLNEAALQRWLAETAWFPTALLPGQSVRWTAIDDSTARATVTSDSLSASLDFHFGADSLVSWVGSDSRARLVGDAFVPTPWRGRWSDWRWIEAQRIPYRGEASWELPTRTWEYWSGTVVSASYE